MHVSRTHDIVATNSTASFDHDLVLLFQMLFQDDNTGALVFLATIHVTSRTVSLVGLAQATLNAVRSFHVIQNGALRR